MSDHLELSQLEKQLVRAVCRREEAVASHKSKVRFMKNLQKWRRGVIGRKNQELEAIRRARKYSADLRAKNTSRIELLLTGETQVTVSWVLSHIGETALPEDFSIDDLPGSVDMSEGQRARIWRLYERCRDITRDIDDAYQEILDAGERYNKLVDERDELNELIRRTAHKTRELQDRLMRMEYELLLADNAYFNKVEEMFDAGLEVNLINMGDLWRSAKSEDFRSRVAQED